MTSSTNQKFSVGQEVFLISDSESNFNPKTGIIQGVHYPENNSFWYRVIYYGKDGLRKYDAWYEQNHIFETADEANLVLNTRLVV